MSTSPAAIAVTSPDDETTAIVVFVESHCALVVTSFVAPSFSCATAVSCTDDGVSVALVIATVVTAGDPGAVGDAGKDAEVEPALPTHAVAVRSRATKGNARHTRTTQDEVEQQLYRYFTETPAPMTSSVVRGLPGNPKYGVPGSIW